MEREFNYENISLTGISLYNLGFSLREVKKKIEEKFNLKVSLETIENWLEEYKDICDYSELRKEALSLYSCKDIVFSKDFYHKQVYRFQYHRAKIDIEKKNGNKEVISPLKDYFEWIAEERKTCPENNKRFSFPHNIFKSRDLSQRASKAKIKKEVPFKTIEDSSKKLVECALAMAKNNYERHQKVQEFMLLNDSLTLACEIPVYLNPSDLDFLEQKRFHFNFKNDFPVTGHIDLIREKKGKVQVLDYKPGASKERPFAQLLSYAFALSLRTGLDLEDISCAWFDENDYFELSPLSTSFFEKQTKLSLY